MISFSSLFGDDADILRESNFQILFIANMIGPLGLALMSPVLESLTGPFGVSAANVGLLISAFTAPPIVMTPIAGNLSDRYGRKPVLLAGLLVFGTAGVTIAFTTRFRVALGLRFLQGIGFAATTPIIITSIGDLYKGNREAAGQGFRFTGSGLTSTLFPFIAGVTVGIAWQYPFLLYAITFPVVILVYLMLEEPTADMTPETSNDSGGSPDVEEDLTLWDLLRNRRVQAMVAVRGFPNMAYVGFLTYNSIIVVQLLDGTPAGAGLLAAVVSVSFAAAATQAGRITAVSETRLYPLVAANVALGTGFAIVLFVPGLLLAIPGVVVSGIGFGVTLSIYRSIITDLAPPTHRGSIVSVAEGYGRLTVTLTPVLMGGIVTVVQPRFGFELSIRTAVLAITTVASGCGILGLLVASNATAPQFGD